MKEEKKIKWTKHDITQALGKFTAGLIQINALSPTSPWQYLQSIFTELKCFFNISWESPPIDHKWFTDSIKSVAFIEDYCRETHQEPVGLIFELLFLNLYFKKDYISVFTKKGCSSHTLQVNLELLNFFQNDSSYLSTQRAAEFSQWSDAKEKIEKLTEAGDHRAVVKLCWFFISSVKTQNMTLELYGSHLRECYAYFIKSFPLAMKNYPFDFSEQIHQLTEYFERLIKVSDPSLNFFPDKLKAYQVFNEETRTPSGCYPDRTIDFPTICSKGEEVSAILKRQPDTISDTDIKKLQSFFQTYFYLLSLEDTLKILMILASGSMNQKVAKSISPIVESFLGNSEDSSTHRKLELLLSIIKTKYTKESEAEIEKLYGICCSLTPDSNLLIETALKNAAPSVLAHLIEIGKRENAPDKLLDIFFELSINTLMSIPLQKSKKGKNNKGHESPFKGFVREFPFIKFPEFYKVFFSKSISEHEFQRIDQVFGLFSEEEKGLAAKQFKELIEGQEFSGPSFKNLVNRMTQYLELRQPNGQKTIKTKRIEVKTPPIEVKETPKSPVSQPPKKNPVKKPKKAPKEAPISRREEPKEDKVESVTLHREKSKEGKVEPVTLPIEAPISFKNTPPKIIKKTTCYTELYNQLWTFYDSDQHQEAISLASEILDRLSKEEGHIDFSFEKSSAYKNKRIGFERIPKELEGKPADLLKTLIFLNLAYINWLNKKYNLVVNHCKEILSLYKNNPWVWTTLVSAYKEQKKYQLAKETLEEMLKIAPQKQAPNILKLIHEIERIINPGLKKETPLKKVVSSSGYPRFYTTPPKQPIVQFSEVETNNNVQNSNEKPNEIEELPKESQKPLREEIPSNPLESEPAFINLEKGYNDQTCFQETQKLLIDWKEEWKGDWAYSDFCKIKLPHINYRKPVEEALKSLPDIEEYTFCEESLTFTAKLGVEFNLNYKM